MSKELELIRDFWKPVIKEIVGNLTTMTDSRGHNRRGGNNLSQQITAFNSDMVIETLTDYISTVSAPEYAKLVDKGVKGYNNKYKNTGEFSFKRNGKSIPTKAIRGFMLNRGIVPRLGGKRVKLTNPEKQLNSIAYLIGKAIKRDGIEAVPFYSSVLTEDLINDFSSKILDVMGGKFLDNITP